MSKITKTQLVKYITEKATKLYEAEILKEEKLALERKVSLLESGSYPVTFEYTDYSTGTSEGEKTYTVTCNVTPGSSGSYYEEPEAGQVEFLEIIDLETGMGVDVNSLSPELVRSMAEKAEEIEIGGPNFEWD